MQHKLVKAHALFKTPQKTTLKLKKLLLPVAAVVLLLNGCASERLSSNGSDNIGMVVVNDTMALVAFQLWDEYEYNCGFSTCDRTDYYDWGLSLVDMRGEHEKIYWEKRAGIKYKSYLKAAPLDDSTMVFWDNSNSFWFWKLDNDKPQHVKTKWVSDSMPYERIRSWKNEVFLIIRFEKEREMTTYGILDTVNGTINKWIPTNDFAWLNDCIDAKWDSNKEEYNCLVVSEDKHNLFLLKNTADTLHISIPQNIGIEGCVSLQSKLIGISPYCGGVNIWPQTIFFVDSNMQILPRKPIYFLNGSVFADSLGNEAVYY